MKSEWSKKKCVSPFSLSKVDKMVSSRQTLKYTSCREPFGSAPGGITRLTPVSSDDKTPPAEKNLRYRSHSGTFLCTRLLFLGLLVTYRYDRKSRELRRWLPARWAGLGVVAVVYTDWANWESRRVAGESSSDSGRECARRRRRGNFRERDDCRRSLRLLADGSRWCWSAPGTDASRILQCKKGISQSKFEHVEFFVNK